MDFAAFRFDFAGEEFCALPENALWWPRHSALLVADLHLEKGSWFAKNGQLLPPYDSLDTLARLTALAARVDAQSIWCLGDNFHDPAGPDRMDNATQAALGNLAARHAVHFILGNHDVRSGVSTHLPDYNQRAEAQIGGIILRHEADICTDLPDISGHWHPKIRLRAGMQSGARSKSRHGKPSGTQSWGRTISRPCFVKTQKHLILPAFGAYTGGLDVTDPAMRPIVQAADNDMAVAMISLKDHVVQCTLSAAAVVA